MRLGKITIRLAALLVLLTSFSDYWAYDRWDPAAPMNASGPEAVAAFDFHVPSGACWHSTNLSDDHCICCSPVIARPAPVVPHPALRTSPLNEFGPTAISAALNPPAMPAPPFPDPTGSDRPLRV
jgi:hypothetical protein